MTKNNFLLIAGCTFGLTILTPSCTQPVSESVSLAALTSTVVDENRAALISDDIDNELDTYVSDSVLNTYKNPQAKDPVTFSTLGPVITINKPDTLYPKIFTLDYGTSGVTLANGNILKGKIIAFVDTKMKLKNSSRIISFVSFSENGNAFKGSKTLTYMGDSNTKPATWNVSNKDTITGLDGAKIIWNSERIRVRSGLNGTPLLYSDDYFSISGKSNGVDSKGVVFDMQIRNNYPLLIGGNYPFYVKGLISVTISKGNVVVDFGKGTKDKNSTLLVNGVSSEFVFP